MAAATVFIAPLPNQETCTLTGLAVSVTPDNAALSVQLFVTSMGVSQDPADESAPVASSSSSAAAFAVSLPSSSLIPTPSSASFSSRRRRIRSVVSRAPAFNVQRTFNAVSVSGSTVIPWTVDVPEGFYVVSAKVNGANDAHITSSPRFFVQEGSDTSCILDSTSLSQSSTLAASTSSAPTPSGSGNKSHGEAQGRVSSDPSKLGIPIAAIVGIIIAVVIFAVLGVLICKWDRQRHRNAAKMRKVAEPAQPHVMSSTSTFFDRGPGTMFATAVTRTN